MKVSICAVVMLAAAGSFCEKPKCVWKAASKAVLAGEPAAKPSNGFTSVLMPAKMYSPLIGVLRIEVSVSSAARPLSLVTRGAASPETLAVSTPRNSCAALVMLAERFLRRGQPRRNQAVGIDDAVQPLQVAREGDGLRGARAERQAAVEHLAGVELLLRFDEVALGAHGRIAHRLRDGEGGDERGLHRSTSPRREGRRASRRRRVISREDAS